jgi:hypothetical protein
MTHRSTPNDGLTEAQKNYPTDQKRIRTQKAALLDLLQDRKWHPNYQLAEVGGLSFNSYLYHLRLDGWVIESRPVRGGVWEQKLVGRGNPPPRQELSRPQQRVLDDFALAVQKVYGAQGLERVRGQLSPWLNSAPQLGDPIGTKTPVSSAKLDCNDPQ